jgi:hypothetical protein
MFDKTPWTFGIITDGNNPDGLHDCIRSIGANISYEHEILVVGGIVDVSQHYRNVKYIPFDESIRPGWITRKKNIIADIAQFSKICVMHDYYKLEPGWLAGWNSMPDTWKVATNKIVNKEGKRHSDWLINPERISMMLRKKNDLLGDLRSINPTGDPKYVCGLPYEVRGLEKIQYISGGYMCVNKGFFRMFPLDERLTWGQDEDVEWSQMINMFTTIELNPNSLVTANRPNKWSLDVLPLNIVAKISEFYGLDTHVVTSQ